MLSIRAGARRDEINKCVFDHLNFNREVRACNIFIFFTAIPEEQKAEQSANILSS